MYARSFSKFTKAELNKYTKVISKLKFELERKPTSLNPIEGRVYVVVSAH